MRRGIETSHSPRHSKKEIRARGSLITRFKIFQFWFTIFAVSTQLVERFKKSYQVPDSLFYKDLHSMLQHIKPVAVLAYNSIADHLSVVEACAPKGISAMVEKPLATTVKDAECMQALARQHKIQLLTNYETTWYASNHQLYKMVKEQAIGDIRKIVVHDGHQGPKEIGCSSEFLAWLTDPI